MYKLTLTAILVLTAALVAFASTAAASGGKGRLLSKSGTCSATSHWKLEVKSDDGRLETQFEVDQNRVGKRWRVKIAMNGSTVFRGIARTHVQSGSFEVRRILAGGAGARIVATAKALSGGETCRAAISELSRSHGAGGSLLRPRRAQTRLSLAQSAACVRSVTPIWASPIAT